MSNKMKQTKIKEPVKLRGRLQKSGRTALYLDIYANGRRKCEHLKLYLIPESTREDKEKNRETLRFAEAIRAKRVLAIHNNIFGFEDTYKLDTLFVEYFKGVLKKSKTKGTQMGWMSTLNHIEAFGGSDMTFRDISSAWLNRFKSYLDGVKTCRGGLSEATKGVYLGKVKACMNAAYEEGIIKENPFRGVSNYNERNKKERVYLTIDEVRAMAVAECDNVGLKRAFMFSCLTGLRKSDIEKLTWGEVREEGGFTRLVFAQQKTGGREYLDITPQALPYMGERGRPRERVFADFRYGTLLSTELRLWAARAGVDKGLTFHSARHSFAVLMLDIGTDIYTVSKLLGHREIQTTQIYAHILDKKKQEAVARIPDILAK